ncbi:MAG TPA: hypothetical protein QGG70_02440 [Candidatus Pacearchaeota archaeon]|jgi:uncharacterized protein with ATP-grasp and redox domains|nr:hypothetical protein [Candidatus Pacearchaeota archaeon]|tara:strand:- start:957 stop:1415 length:459 start_codon:yes stop_codon:yes gene_type:complete
MEQYEQNLKEAARHLQIADHMTYVTFPLINDHRLLLKIFDEIYGSIIGCVNAILNYEAMYKRIKLYSGINDNFNTFARIGKNYNLSNEQVKRIKELIELNKKHKKSAMEFVRQDKVVIMSDNLGTQVLDLITIKKYLLLAKELMMKVREKIN